MEKIKFKKRGYVKGTPGIVVSKTFSYRGYLKAWSTAGADGEIYPVALVVDRDGLVHIVDIEHLKFEDW